MGRLINYRDIIRKVLLETGFSEEQTNTADFDASFTKRGIITNLAFLVKEVIESDYVSSDIEKIISNGRKWCVKNLKATWITKESGLNIILLHKGYIDSFDIKGQVDMTGLHGAICQSVTNINESNGNIEQEKTWIVIGKVKKALRKLKEIDSS
jgi:hypothetical protein